MSTNSQTSSPLLTAQKFSDLTGMPYKTVKDRISKGELPVIRWGLDPDKGSTPYVNVEKVKQICREQEFNHPVLSRS